MEYNESDFWQWVEGELYGQFTSDEWSKFYEEFYEKRNEAYNKELKSFLAAVDSKNFNAKVLYQDFSELIACAPILKSILPTGSVMKSIGGCDEFDIEFEVGGSTIPVQVVSSFNPTHDLAVKKLIEQGNTSRKVGAKITYCPTERKYYEGHSAALSVGDETCRTADLVRSAIQKKVNKNYKPNAWLVVTVKDNESMTMLNHPGPNNPYKDLQLGIARKATKESLKGVQISPFARLFVTCLPSVLFDSQCTP